MWQRDVHDMQCVQCGAARRATSTASRRQIMSGGAVLGSAALAASCNLAGAGEPPPAAKEVTLTYFTDWTGGTRAEWVKTALPKFTQENPKITVQAEFAQGDAKAAALANAAAGTLSDVMLGGGDIPHHLAKAGALAEITPTLKALRFKMDDIVWIPSTISVKGKQYGLPFAIIPPRTSGGSRDGFGMDTAQVRHGD